MIRASCLCGDVVWEAEAPLELITHCHCTFCRKSHGAAFGTYGAAKAEGFRWVQGLEGVRQYESSPGFNRPFCGRCGSVVAGEPEDGQVYMPVGCVDGDPGALPLAHIFVAAKAPWLEIAGELPRFDGYPPGMPEPDVPELTRPDTAEGRLAGSCLCGAVAYEVDGPFELIRHCHCSRCRKGRSAAHASNAFTGVDRFRWIRGEDEIESFAVPDAKFFTQDFCGTCGGLTPRVSRERGFVLIPAGSLDDDPGGRPREHIFVGSKAPWFTIEDELPRHEEGPPRG